MTNQIVFEGDLLKHPVGSFRFSLDDLKNRRESFLQDFMHSIRLDFEKRGHFVVVTSRLDKQDVVVSWGLVSVPDCYARFAGEVAI